VNDFGVFPRPLIKDPIENGRTSTTINQPNNTKLLDQHQNTNDY